MNEDFKTSACPEYEPMLEDHLSGELGGPDAARLSEHIKSCLGCTSALKFASASTRLLAVGGPIGDPGPGFAHLVMARIRTELDNVAAQKSIWLPFVSLAWRFAATASLAAVVLLAYDATSNRQAVEQMAVLRADEPHDLISDAGRPPQNRDQTLLMMAETNHGK
ncbi:MAG: zf-HC2 domain-containing protein [Candidatus Acidiferrales bacterium]